MKLFAVTRDGYVCHLAQDQRLAIIHVVDAAIDILESDITPTVPGEWGPSRGDRPTPPGSPRDPAAQRLLPDAAVDSEVAAEFRRFAAGEIAHRKVQGLRTLRQCLQTAKRITVPQDQANAVAAALTDTRLVLAQRLGLVSDHDVDELYRHFESGTHTAQTAFDAHRHHAEAVFLLLGMLQESLVDGMLAGLRQANSRA